MKFASALAVVALVGSAQAQPGTQDCGVDLPGCVSITPTCNLDGTVTYCMAPTGAPGCKTEWSHANWWTDSDLDTSDVTSDTGDLATCATSNNGCNVSPFNAFVGVKDDDGASTFCVTVTPGAPVLLAIKDRSGCTGSGGGWSCSVGTCECGGSGGGACIIQPPPMSCPGGPAPTPPTGPTDPVPTPTPPAPTPGIDGDPHIKTWNGKWFDYMGECDLNMMTARKFDGHKDMTIHARTTIQYDYSYMESAAIQIGDDILEVGSYGDYAVNGVDTPYLGGKASHIGGYPLYHTQVNKKKHIYDIVIGKDENITLASYKQLVSVHINVDADREKFFGRSEGLLGAYSGDLLARDGRTVMSDMDAFGQEWQVTDDEAKLFRTARAPQYPVKCNMPAPKSSTKRRLGETIAEEAAEKACSNKVGAAFNNCVYDVMAIGDLELANAGSY